MTDTKKLKLSEIRAWSEMAATRHWDIQRISYLLDLVARMGKVIRDNMHKAPDGVTCMCPACKQARALLEELGK